MRATIIPKPANGTPKVNQIKKNAINATTEIPLETIPITPRRFKR
jgi:hypothetical protein